MNGRVYDYNLGRFMSVDPFVHEGSQGINPYSYIMNNPLSGVDPSGYKPCKAEDSVDCLGDGANEVKDDKGKTTRIIVVTDNGAADSAPVTGQQIANMIAEEMGKQGTLSFNENVNSTNVSASTISSSKGVAGLSQQDLTDAATAIGTDEAAILAVGELESGNNGFLASGDPKILFEAHIFSNLTKGKYDKSNPDISSATWDKSLYSAGSAEQRGHGEYMRLSTAMSLDADAAIKATSWGRFQILGLNHKAAGYKTPKAFMSAMLTSEVYHLKAFVNFVNRSTIRSQSLQNHNWARFARNYNGPAFKANRYDTRLSNAYKKYSTL